MFSAIYIGEVGLYKNQEYIIRIGMINGHIVVNRKCGAGRKYYGSIIEFLKDWDKIKKV